MKKALACGTIVISFGLGFIASRAMSGGEAEDLSATAPHIPVPAAVLHAWLPPIGDYDTGGELLSDDRFEALMTALHEVMEAEETLADFGWEGEIQLINFFRRLARPAISEEQKARVSAYLEELQRKHPEHRNMIARQAGSVDYWGDPLDFTPRLSSSQPMFVDSDVVAGFDTGGQPFTDAQVDQLLAWIGTMLTIPETVSSFPREAEPYLLQFSMLVKQGQMTDDQSERTVTYLEEVKATHPASADMLDRHLYELRNLVPGRVAPNIVGTDTEGVEFALEEYRGNIVVLVFGGHWCAPCREEYPYHRFMLELYEDKPVVLLGVYSDAKLETIRQAKIDEELGYRTWWDGHGDVPTSGPIATDWNVMVWPQIYVLDEEGVIRYVDKRGIDLIGTVDRMLDEMTQRNS